MNDTKKLFFAIVAGAGVSLLCCLAFTSLTSPRADQGQKTKIGHEAEARQSALAVPSMADSQPSAKVETEQPVVETPLVVTRQTKAAKTGKIAAKPRRPRASSNVLALPLITPQTTLTQPATDLQSGDASVPARPVTAPEARAALKELGTNPAAEAVWIAAINDANMPAAQRKDLIEDLNEEGFADPKHLTVADLPRIENRLALIEDLAPQAIDQTNADAFQEAYKDLNNMRDGLAKP